MSNSIELSFDEDFIRIRLYGFRSFKELQIIWKRILQYIQNSNKNCLIEDNLEGKINIIDIYKLVRFIDSSGLNRHRKTAIILKDSKAYDVIYFDILSVNRFYQIRHFPSETEAINWLKMS
jgi:hypothetical protein